MPKRALPHSSTYDVPHKKHKVLDLRNKEFYQNFHCHKFVFKVHSLPTPVTTHTTSSEAEIEQAQDIVSSVLKQGLEYMHDHDIPPYAVIHLYLKCEGMDQDFKFIGAGASKLTLKQLRGGGLDSIVEGFSRMIQSGANVSIDDHTVITYYAFIPPIEYR